MGRAAICSGPTRCKHTTTRPASEKNFWLPRWCSFGAAPETPSFFGANFFAPTGKQAECEACAEGQWAHGPIRTSALINLQQRIINVVTSTGSDAATAPNCVASIWKNIRYLQTNLVTPSH